LNNEKFDGTFESEQIANQIVGTLLKRHCWDSDEILCPEWLVLLLKSAISEIIWKFSESIIKLKIIGYRDKLSVPIQHLHII
jgi:hypothetical protein